MMGHTQKISYNRNAALSEYNVHENVSGKGLHEIRLGLAT
jgi:hypothetical protein